MFRRVPPASASLQSKREMFFKTEAGSGGGGGGGPPLSAPSAAPPAPPVSAPSSAPPPPPSSTAPAPAAPTSAPPASVASIKEQLMTTKERKEHKEEENKENKLVKELVRERRPREVDGYVGFANLPNQVYRKAVKRGFEFSLMLVGESGLGKSTLINSMFLADIYSNDHPGPSHRVKKTVQVETTKVLLKENGVNLMLTVVDTPGFGDAVDNSDCWQPVTNYVESKYEEYLNCESRVNRTQISDTRVHCCLYFIAPSGHGLKPLDVEYMRRLHDKVNIIPVIAKADTLTPDECQHLKKQVLNEIAQHKIKIYEFPDEEGDATSAKMKQRVPFAVVGSNTTVEVDGKKVRGRKYPWGVVEVENIEHCDFIPLRNMMIRTHMQDLKDVTNNVHYENYRCRKLAGVGGTDGKIKMTNKCQEGNDTHPCPSHHRNPLAQMEEEKREHTNRMKKMESEMEQVFEMKVKEKMTKLSDLESDLQKRNESMRKKLEADFAELEEERERFEKERKAWEAANGTTVDELRRKSLESISRETSSLASSTTSGSSRKSSPKFSRTYSLPRHKFKQGEQCTHQ
ncbi:septin-7-like isoform X6 [Scylla paramamosain]|uniref:septin-7-like isoform X6 n=1 Tax=Scylla paramamosain TaxID=85552 RepID=UPI003083D48F